MAKNASLVGSLFCKDRFYEEKGTNSQLVSESLSSCVDGDFCLESDRLRLAFAGPVRRLHQKTQVFPLDINAATRNRLTHSLETQAYARSIALNIVSKTNADIKDYDYPLILCVSNAALVHDLGNPPFGHFGEALIRRWLSHVVELPYVHAELNDVEREDIKAFNGNAQTIRQLHSLQHLNLTLGQLSALLKVPYTVSEILHGTGIGSELRPTDNFFDWAYANAGVFLSEKPLLDAIRTKRGSMHRHPFASIVDWADELSYVLADLEDATTREVIGRYDIINLFAQIIAKPEFAVLKDTFAEEKLSMLYIHAPSSVLNYIRNVVSKLYVQDITDAVCDNFAAFINTGDADFSKRESYGIRLVNEIKNYEKTTIYTNHEIESLELSGASYIMGILSKFENLLGEDVGTFQKELAGRGGDPFLRRLARRITRRCCETYYKACMERRSSEMYARIRLIVDYVSGMSDTYAKHVFKVLSGH